jgi:hypothetical protein
MATGRTVTKWDRVYLDGLDMSGYVTSLGPLMWSFDEVDYFALSDPAQGALPGLPHISPGVLNGIFDNTATTSLHALASGAGSKRLVTLARGTRAAPIAGDACFVAYAVQDDYLAVQTGQAAMVTVKFGQVEQTTEIPYADPWGWLLHPLGIETTGTLPNIATGIDDLISPATTSANGGYFWYHLLTSNGTVTLVAQHAAANNNGSFATINAATSGAIDATAAPLFGIVAVPVGQTVNRYLRFNAVMGSATTCKFVSGFVRG